MRKRAIFVVAAVLLSGGESAFADRNGKDRDIRALEQRVVELEAQNRSILVMLQELKEQLAAGTTPITEGGPRLPGGERVDQPEASDPSREMSEPTLPTQIKVGSSRLGFYGFVRVDAIVDDSKPNHPQFPSFVVSEDPSVGPRNDGQTSLHPRLTRVGMNYSGPDLAALGGASLSGKIEFDFQNGGRESRQAIRMRHGWLKLSWQDWSLLTGQAWDAFSPLYPTVNSDSLMWNAGNLGDRRPQLRFAYQPKDGHVSFVGGLGLTGAIDSQDLDGDGVRDGEASSLPHLQARLGFSGSRWSLGLSGHHGQEQTATPIAGRNDFDTYSASLDVDLTLSDRARLKGEVWTGRNLSDVRGGIGQGINRLTGREIDSEGGWLELGLKLTDTYSLYGGFTIDDPTDSDVPAGGRTRNSTWYLVHRFRFGPPFMLGIDYLRWTTEFSGLEDGTDHRFNLYLVYNF